MPLALYIKSSILLKDNNNNNIDSNLESIYVSEVDQWLA